MKNKLKITAKKLFPAGTGRRKFLKLILQKTKILGVGPPDLDYYVWAKHQERKQFTDAPRLRNLPLISIVVPAYNTPMKYFLPMLYSVVNQTYQNWELVIVNASVDEGIKSRIDRSSQVDRRIKIISTKENKGISGNTNVGINNSAGEYVAFLDHDDVLEPTALYEVARAINSAQKPDILYSDEDKLTEDGEFRADPHFKPDWSPELFLELNYLNHFRVIKTSLIHEIGGLKDEYNGAQDYELFLRLSEITDKFLHIPKVLYHWRAAESSTASDISTKKYVLEAGAKALQDYYDRNAIAATASALVNKPGFYVTRYAINDNQFVLSAEKNWKMFINFIKSQQSEIVVHNRGVRFNLDEWAEVLSGVASQKQLGAVSPAILDSKGRVLDMGYIYTTKGAKPLFKGIKFNTHTYFGDTDWVRNVDILSGKCFATKTSLILDYQKEAEEKGSFQGYFQWLKEKKFRLVIWSHVVGEYNGNIQKPSTAKNNMIGRPSLFNDNLETRSKKIVLSGMEGIKHD